ncbi:hypothetical protein EV363DRAFT_1150687, partial [Boletus edulis]
QRERETLHISVESGGCHGYHYKMALANVRRRNLKDYSSIQSSYASRYPVLKCVYIDAVSSFPMLNGSMAD